MSKQIKSTNFKAKKALVAGAMAAGLALGSTAVSAENNSRYSANCAKEPSFSDQARDAWLQGKLETTYTLNEHLNPFAIQTSVNCGHAYLSGAVESGIDKDLAGELAEGVPGVLDVENRLTVAKDYSDPDAKDEERSGFLAAVSDATTSAAIKTRLMMNEHTRGQGIDVSTEGATVRLEGKVESEQVKELAEQIALNVDDVAEVNNELSVQ